MRQRVPAGADGPRGDGTTNGFVVVDKEPGWTSHDVVARCRRIFGQRRVGHAGTLDPAATGVLVVGLGTATRLLRFASVLGKSYVGEIVLGAETSTLDAEGLIVARHDMSGVSPEDVAREAVALTGRILQTPPMVSAVKVGGRRLHELAREGIEIEREARPVTVSRFDVTRGNGTDETSVYRVEVDCSSGTYIRVLAADLGRALGGGAYLRSLRRVAVGSFGLAEAVLVGDLDSAEFGRVSDLMRDYPTVPVDAEMAAGVTHGKVFDRSELQVSGDGPWAVTDERGELLAVYEARGPERAKPAVVMPVASAGAHRVAVRGMRSSRPGPQPINRDGDDGRASWGGSGGDRFADGALLPAPGSGSPAPAPARAPAPSAVTIGAFDGVHIGHRRLLGELRRSASKLGLRSVVVTFDRHPAAVVRPESAPALLTDLDQKLALLSDEGVDEVVVVRFDEEAAKEPAEEFVRRVLIGQLNTKLVIVGRDFHFGHARSGNVALLERMGSELGFSVVPYDLVADPHADIVSSTRIRTFIREGDIEAAASLLGRPHEVTGVVVAREPELVIGVIEEVAMPGRGSYEVELRPADSRRLPAVACVASLDQAPDGERSANRLTVRKRSDIESGEVAGRRSLARPGSVDPGGEIDRWGGVDVRVRFIARAPVVSPNEPVSELAVREPAADSGRDGERSTG